MAAWVQQNITKAFDDAWEQIAPSIGKMGAVEAARHKLANVVLSLPRNGLEAERLTKEALRIMGARPPTEL